jgi:hypothetical protein
MRRRISSLKHRNTFHFARLGPADTATLGIE